MCCMIQEKISVCPPDFYATRFIEFMTDKVFKKASKINFKNLKSHKTYIKTNT